MARAERASKTYRLLGASDPAGGRGGSLRRAAVVGSDLADTEDDTSFVRSRVFPVRSNATGAREYVSRVRLAAREQKSSNKRRRRSLLDVSKTPPGTRRSPSSTSPGVGPIECTRSRATAP
jgi:hypothetical protein